MMLPQALLRKQWLRRALRHYPLYDPPYKVEERLLSRTQAQGNFDYFMQTRQERVGFLVSWLERYFWTTITIDSKGVKALNRWGNKYAGLLQLENEKGRPTNSFFTYQPPWLDENAGCNVLFDMGTVFGEIFIATTPKLYWALEPTAELLPRSSRLLQKIPGMSFQRPNLTGWDDPTNEMSVHHSVWQFAYLMTGRMTTFEGYARYKRMGRIDRRHFRDQLINSFLSISRKDSADLDEFTRLRRDMAPDEYARLMDDIAEKEITGDGRA
jgi:hypothetical protein